MAKWAFGGSGKDTNPKPVTILPDMNVKPKVATPTKSMVKSITKVGAVAFPGGIPEDAGTTNNNWRYVAPVSNTVGVGGDGSPSSLPSSLSSTSASTVPIWNVTYNLANAPEWWKGKTYTGDDDASDYATMVNAMIPYLSHEDARTMATYLFQNFPKAFPEYNPETVDFGAVPKLDESLQERFTSQARAKEALSTLDSMVAGSGKAKDKYGTGYTFLRTLLDTLQDFGGADSSNQQTRQQVVQQLSALDPLLNSAKGELAPYASLAQALTTPFFSEGKVIPIRKDANGDYIFGEPNKQLY